MESRPASIASCRATQPEEREAPVRVRFCEGELCGAGGLKNKLQRVEKYQKRAIELRELAEAMKNQQARLSLLHLAASYDSLAVNLKAFDKKLESSRHY
jgi:hypothetical protein